MNVFHKVALRGLKNSRARTAVTIVGVMLSAALITGVVTFGLSLLDYAAAGAEKKYGGWHVAFLDVDAAFAAERSADPEAAGTFVINNVGYAPLSGGKNPDKPYLYVTGFSEETFSALPLTLLSGRMPENEREILIPTHVSSNGGVELGIGDTLTLSLGSRESGGRRLGQHDPYIAGETFSPAGERTYTVTGLYLRPAFEEYTAPGYTAVTKAEEGAPPSCVSLFAALKNPRRAHAYGADKAGGRAVMFNNRVLRFFGLSDDPSDNLFNALLFTVGGIVVAIVMTGSVFLIYNAFCISLNERMRQIGILASVGATARQIRDSVLFEGLCIGAVGIPLGVGLGLAGVRIVIAVVAKNFYSVMYGGVPLALHVSAPAIAAAAAISLGTILISADIPAKKAARTPVMECIRLTNRVKLEPGAAQTPRFIQSAIGLPGALALKNFKRNRKRYRSIVLSLALSVVLFVSASAFVSHLEQTMEKALSFTTYDVGFGTEAMDDEELLRIYARLKTAGGVTEGAYASVLKYTCSLPAGALSEAYENALPAPVAGQTAELPIEVQFLEDGAYLRLAESAGLSGEAVTAGDGTLLAVAVVLNDGKPGEKEIDDFQPLFATPSLRVTLLPMIDGAPERTGGQSVRIACVRLVPPDIPPTKRASASAGQDGYSFQVLAPWSMKARLAPPEAAPDLLVKGMTFSSDNPAQSTAEMQGMLRDGGASSAYLLLNTREVFEENRNYVFISNVFAYTFIVMISLIAVANVFNTVSTNIKLRRRELAMLRSVGMGERDFNRMMRFECVCYGALALMVGLPAAVAASLLIYLGMSGGGAEGIVFRLPWGSVGVSVCSVLLVILATMTYSVSKMKSENIIDALRDDMT